MSVLYHTQERADLKHRGHGFILTLICMALALVVASVVFTPAAVSSEISNDVLVVGP